MCFFYGNQSERAQSFRGVRQGDIFVTCLFALFLNDLESFLSSHNCPCIDMELASEDVYFYSRTSITRTPLEP